MSNLLRRSDVVQYTNSSSVAAPGAAYTVGAFEIGAIGAAVSSGTTVTVDAGHGFATSDYLLLNPGSAATAGYDALVQVTGTTATTLTILTAVSIAVGDTLFNLGPDSATGATPDYDGSGVTIYSDMDGGTTITNSIVTCNVNGAYSYWTKGQDIWELIRDSAGKPVGWAMWSPGIGPALSSLTDNALIRADGADGRNVQGTGVVVDDSNNLDIPGTITVDGGSTLTGNVAMGATATVATTLAVTGATTVGGTLGVTGALTPTGGISTVAYGGMYHLTVATIAATTTAKLMTFNAASPASNITADTVTGRDLTVDAGYGGNYLVNVAGYFRSSAVSTPDIGIVEVYKNGSVTGSVAGLISTVEITAANDRYSFAIAGILALAAADTVDVRFDLDAGTSTVTINMTLSIVRLDI